MDGEPGGSNDIFLSDEEAAANAEAEAALLSGNTTAVVQMCNGSSTIVHGSGNAPIPSHHGTDIGAGGAGTATNVFFTPPPHPAVLLQQSQSSQGASSSCPSSSSCPKQPAAPLIRFGLDLAALSALLGKNPTFARLDRRAGLFPQTPQAPAFLNVS